MTDTNSKIHEMAERVAAGDVRALARAASWVEDGRPEAEALLKLLFPRTGQALVIGITGPPGSGKSTLCDALIAQLRADGKRVGVVAVDPSSPFSGGAILGDRIRMQRHHDDPDVFIRSMATRGWMGGLARAATGMTLLLDAAGREVILVETVGVGQDEVEIARLADVTVVVLVPGMGDDVQAIKAGIMEIAQVFVINKADLSGVEQMERELHAAIALGASDDPEIVRAVATEGRGVPELLAAVQKCAERGRDPEQQAQLWAGRLREMLRDRLLDRFSEDEFLTAGGKVASRERDPYSIVHEWLEGKNLEGNN